MEAKRYRTIPVVTGDNVVVLDGIDIELELRLVAAIKSYQVGAKSMDRLLKQYGEAWREQIEEAIRPESTR